MEQGIFIMQVNKNENRIAFDIDQTLVMYEGNIYQPGDGKVAITCPYDNVTVYYLTPNRRHINILMAKKKRGCEVIAWSQNGWAWAERVVDTLGLREYVDKAETKISSYVDDLPADKWMSRIYVENP